MAVYEHSYKRYEGQLTPKWSRFLIIPRFAYQDIFQSKLFTALFVACFVYPLGALLYVYLHYNTSALELLKIPANILLPIDLSFFNYFLVAQGVMSFFITLYIGPTIISKDITNNAVPLYLCRPMSRTDYLAGKMSVLLILLSAITWIPGLMIYLLQGYLAGDGWLWNNGNIALATFLGSWIWLLVLCLLSQAVSVFVRWRLLASGILLMIFIVPSIMSAIINELFETEYGNVISLRSLIRTIWAGLFNHPTNMELPLTAAWISVTIICAICLFILSRKVRAYEVIE